MRDNNLTLNLRPRYGILDGLRGVAALFVILYHFGEAFATSPVDQAFNHGYLAVDFFFALSGFVLGYAYDGRWQKGMSLKDFMLRRVIRLQPMVVAGAVLGVVAFIIQGCVKWDGTHVGPLAIIGATILTLFMIPSRPGAVTDIRGNNEMFPVNGPSWSLFFEYVGSLCLGLFLHRLSNKGLGIWVFFCAVALTAFAVVDPAGIMSIGTGWSMSDWGLIGGFFRMSFSFSAGLLLFRTFKARKIKGAFWWCSLLIAVVLSCPYIGSEPNPGNVAYDLCMTFLFFPFIVWLGACGTTTDRYSASVCGYLGRLSYPLYITHYPLMYLFYAWVWGGGLGFGQAWPVCVGIFALAVSLATLLMIYWDAPVRRYLTGLLKPHRSTLPAPDSTT